MTTTHSFLFIGCGNMGAAIASGVLSRYPDAAVVAVDPTVDRARALLPAGANVSVLASLDEVGDIRPDITVLAVKPQQFGSLASDERLRRVAETGYVVSIMAGCPLAAIAAALRHDRIARLMPNLPAQIGAGMTVGHALATMPAEGRALIRSVFETVGAFEWLDDEALIDAATAVAGSGPGYAFAFAEQLEAAARNEGLPRVVARRLVAQTLLGAARMLGEDGRDAGSLKQAVASPGGTTEAGLQVLDVQGALPALVPAAVSAARQRACDLSQMVQEDLALTTASSRTHRHGGFQTGPGD